ncbi:protein-disulfide reductase DsbD domain-containing protein [uncultured Paracoccus sp.]|uniref:protein-disulfide reductase DsbD domain-containing protein n=1 Tax=uncultured Paracoccus sp. TaxID=189685 RepID=UPI0026041174|nr:protein-disulfide reductase DsbD domain-containing protein [uncultured Paracoccus sp.]
MTIRTSAVSLAAALAAIFAAPLVHAAEPGGKLPYGLRSAELLPLQSGPDRTTVTAVRLVLEPGWKTYWRSPGDTGVPASFDWSASTNLAEAQPLWPRPEVIDSAGERTLGYHDELVLPIRIAAADADRPVGLKLSMDFGLCEEICVPARVDLAASATHPDDLPAGPDPQLAAALARVPDRGDDSVTCTLTPIDDGVQVAATVTDAGPDSTAALELMQDGVWVSQAEISRADGRMTAVADFVAPSGKPFPLDTNKLRLTLIAPDDAVEYQGCVRS